MTHKDPQRWAQLLPFDPLQGVVIRQPPGAESGYWAGAPGILYDARDGWFYLVYRLRWPRGVMPDRGAEIHLARSRDGLQFEPIWTATKDQLNTSSIERCAIRRAARDTWRLYVSFVDPSDGRWRIDLVQASRPDGFDLRETRPVLTARDVQAEGVKDPMLFRVGNLHHMIVSFARATTESSAEELHATQDVYNTGLIRSATGLATSSNGIDWEWEGEIFGPRQSGWDAYCARIGTLWRQEGIWLALYDGSANVEENYEERTGLAYSFDLRRFYRASGTRPWLTPPQGRGAMRYFDVLDFPHARYYYYEMALPDGSHDLRVYRQEVGH